ncbi:MAG: hypothetical protein ABJE95_19625 [Byssovorax sp.]
MFRIGDKVHTHADGRVIFTPEEGARAGQPFAVRACQSMGIELGGKVITLMGSQILPVASELASAEPSISIGLDVAQVSLDLADWAGNGYARMKWGASITLNRPGLPPMTWLAGHVTWEKGFGFKSDAGGAPKDEFSGKFTDIKVKYKGRTLDPFALPGNVQLI